MDNSKFVTRDLSLELESMGFDEECIAFWTTKPIYKGDPIQLCISGGNHGYNVESLTFKKDYLRQ